MNVVFLFIILDCLKISSRENRSVEMSIPKCCIFLYGTTDQSIFILLPTFSSLRNRKTKFERTHCMILCRYAVIKETNFLFMHLLSGIKTVSYLMKIDIKLFLINYISRILQDRLNTGDYLRVENKIGDLFSTLRSPENNK